MLIFYRSFYSGFSLITYSKVTEENIAPLILDVGQDHQHTDDHGEDDGDDHHQSAVYHLEQMLYFETFKQI